MSTGEERRRMSGWMTSGRLPLAAGLVIAAIAATLLAIRAGDTPSSEDLLVRAGETAQSVGSYRFTMKQGVRGEQSRISFGMDGAVDLRNGLSRFVVRTQAPGFNVECTQIASKTHLYTRVHPSRRAGIGAGWLRSDTKTLLAGAGFQFRPDQLYEQSTRMLKGLERAGSEEIRGVATTRYDGEIDLARFIPRQAASPLPAKLDLQVPVQVFVDDRGLLHRMKYQIRTPQQTQFNYEVTTDLFDYGKPVDVALPPAREVKIGTPQQTATACVPAT